MFDESRSRQNAAAETATIALTDSAATPDRLFYRDRGLACNCVAVLDMARFLAELLERQLVVSPCFGTATFCATHNKSCAEHEAFPPTKGSAHWEPDPWEIYTVQSLSSCQRAPRQHSVRAARRKAVLGRGSTNNRDATCVDFFHALPSCGLSSCGNQTVSQCTGALLAVLLCQLLALYQ